MIDTIGEKYAPTCFCKEQTYTCVLLIFLDFPFLSVVNIIVVSLIKTEFTGDILMHHCRHEFFRFSNAMEYFLCRVRHYYCIYIIVAKIFLQ